MSDLATTDPTSLVPQVDRDAILKHLNLDPGSTSTQALLLICERYGLDPLLKHMVLIQGRPYVTRDGYLAIAHRSGVLDGVEVLEEGDSDDHWWARVAVHRKDMSRPFTYVGRYPHSGGNKGYGPEMAVKCAEVAALRRAFNVTGVGAADERWDDHMEATPVEAPERLQVIMDRFAELPADKNEALYGWVTKHIFDGETGWVWEDIPEGWWERLEGFLDKADADTPADGLSADAPALIEADSHEPAAADPPAEFDDDDPGRPM